MTKDKTSIIDIVLDKCYRVYISFMPYKEVRITNMPETLPKFPNFRPFTINDTTWFYDYYMTNSLNPYVDIHPQNLFVWLNINNDLMISKLENSVVLRYTNILDDNKTNIVPLSNPLNESVVEKVLEYLDDNGFTPEIHEIPSTICINLDQNRLLIENDRDSYEYILDTTQQSSLLGSDFSRQRRRIKFFEREHFEDIIEVKYYNEIDDDLKKTFQHHIDTMSLNSNEESSKRNIVEPTAIIRNLEYASFFHKQALVIIINNKVVSITMMSPLDNKTVAINHLKVDYSVQYIFQYTIYQLAKILKEHDFLEMNLEQDLGIDGLRIFKERLQPSRYLEKKIIRPRA